MEDIVVNNIEIAETISVSISESPEVVNITIHENQDSNTVVLPADQPDIVNISVNDALPESITITIQEVAQGPQGPPGIVPVFSANIPVSNLQDSQIIHHNLNTSKILVSFFNVQGRQESNIDWEIVSSNSIKVYLPFLDDATASFSGDIYVLKRF